MEEEEEEEAFPFTAAAEPAAADGWEAVPPPQSPAEFSRGWEMVAAGGSAYDDDDFSVFPPSRHEGLHLQPHPPPTLPPPSRHQEPAAVPGEHPSPPPILDEEEGLPWGRRQILDSAKRFIGSGMEFIHSKLPSRRGGEGAVWSFAALAGLVGALLYLRRRHQREKALFLFLIQEKDQKISQLLHQIAEMNEIIAARHRVSVLRRT